MRTRIGSRQILLLVVVRRSMLPSVLTGGSRTVHRTLPVVAAVIGTLLAAPSAPPVEGCVLHDCWDMADPSLYESLSASRVLGASIARHDSQGVWSSLPIEITTEVRYGTRLAESRGYPSRRDQLKIDNASGLFRDESQRAGNRTQHPASGMQAAMISEPTRRLR
jgi:hypothetical protein